MLNCEFTDPVYWDSGTGSLLPNDTSVKPISNWQFSKYHCEGSFDFSTSTLPMDFEKIISQDQEKEFFLQKSISYGDFLITSFFIILIIGFSVFFIRDFAKNRKLERL